MEAPHRMNRSLFRRDTAFFDPAAPPAQAGSGFMEEK
jgi:hypothetical protein